MEDSQEFSLNLFKTHSLPGCVCFPDPEIKLWLCILFIFLLQSAEDKKGSGIELMQSVLLRALGEQNQALLTASSTIKRTSLILF